MSTILALIASLCQNPNLHVQLGCHRQYVNCLIDKDYFSKPKDEKLLACVIRMGRTD